MVRLFGKFSVKLAHAINTPLDAFGVGICSTSRGLRAPPQEKDVGGEMGSVGSCVRRVEFEREITAFGHQSL